MPENRDRLGILVGGGPSPGINSAISASVIEAVNSGLEVIGIYNGFKHLMAGDKTKVRPLSIGDVSRVHTQGGSILYTSRANPTSDPGELQRSVNTLKELGVTRLVTIGGDDTAFSAYEVAKAAEGAIRVAHVPKTIDNDLPLPGNMPTFGFETARHLGTGLVSNLMEDSRTTGRWYFVVAMGRKAGHLALGIGKAAGATLTVIAEEFEGDRVTLEGICAILEGAILKQRMMGREDGLAVVAEGVAEKIDPDELATVMGVQVEYDPHGHMRLAEIPLAAILRRRVQQRLAELGHDVGIIDVTMGYELRSASPIPFDIDYTRTLGYGAIRFLLSAPVDERLRYGGLICLEGGHSRAISFEELRDPNTGRNRVRLVDMNSQHYQAAAEYMIRLKQNDLLDDRKLEELSQVAGLASKDFYKRFSGAVLGPGAPPHPRP